jgi:hypothetical protein
MMLALTRGARFRVAAFLAALAVACFALPPLTIAFASPDEAAHCLVHADHGQDKTGVTQANASRHADQERHAHGKADHKSACCSAFFSVALSPDAGALTFVPRDPAVALAATPDFQGRIPEQPDRPPISHLSY